MENKDLTEAKLLLRSLYVIMALIFSNTTYGIEELPKNSSCDRVYREALGGRKAINFSLPVGGLTCPTNHGVKYHCLIDEHQRQVQLCFDWSWMDPGLCPRYYSIQGKLNTRKCDVSHVGCPKKRYFSYNYYKYPACFSETMGSPVSDHSRDARLHVESSNTAAVAVPIVVVLVISAVAGGAFVIYSRRHHHHHHHHERNHRPDEPTGNEEDAAQETVPLQPEADPYFMHTRALDAARRGLHKYSCILVTGKPGSGVSTLIQHLWGTYQKQGYLCLDLTDKDRAIENLDENGDAKSFIHVSDSVLSDLIHANLLTKLTDKLQEERAGSVIIVEAAHSWYQSNIDQLRSTFPKARIINLSKEMKFDHFEKRAFLEKLCMTKGICLDESKIREIADFEEKNHGFPILCVTLVENGNFENPVKFLRDEDEKGLETP